MEDNNGGNGKEPKEQQELFLTVKYLPDGTIDVKGTILNNEMLAIWLLDKVKDMVKANTMNKLMKARSKIVKPGGIMNFVRGKNGR